MDFQLTIPTLASDCWPATPQLLLNEAFSKTRGQLQDLTGVIISQTEPDPDDQDKAWFRVDANGREDGYFVFGAGTWNRENPEAPSSGARRLFVGTEAAVWSYDGGDGSDPATTTPGATVGAMWEVDRDFDGRSPMGPGDIPGTDPAVNLAQGANLGAGEVTLDPDQVAPHTHPLAADSTIEDGDNIRVVTSGSGASGLLVGSSGSTSTALSVAANELTGDQEPVSVVHPVRGIWVIKRTARTHYVA